MRGATHYDVLGVTADADDSEITRAYRRAVRTVHPDRGGRAEDFHVIQAAYDCLRDAGTRSRYDTELADALRADRDAGARGGDTSASDPSTGDGAAASGPPHAPAWGEDVPTARESAPRAERRRRARYTPHHADDDPRAWRPPPIPRARRTTPMPRWLLVLGVAQWSLLTLVTVGALLVGTLGAQQPADALATATVLYALVLAYRIWRLRSGAGSVVAEVLAVLWLLQWAGSVTVLEVPGSFVALVVVVPYCSVVTELLRRDHRSAVHGRGAAGLDRRENRRLRDLATTWNAMRIGALEPGHQLRWIEHAVPVYGRTQARLADTRTYTTETRWIGGTWRAAVWVLLRPNGSVVASCGDEARRAWEQLDAVRRASV